MFTSPRTRHRQWEGVPHKLQHVGAITAWGLFILNSYGFVPGYIRQTNRQSCRQTSLQSRKVAELKPPIFKPYTENAHDKDIMWTPYPRFNQADRVSKPAYLQFVMTKIIDLTKIIADIPDLLFDKGLDMAIGELWIAANKKWGDLQRWLESLPNILENDDEKPPQILYL